MARRKQSGLTLPWEERQRGLRRFLSGSRWKNTLAFSAIAVAVGLLWSSADERHRREQSRAAIATMQRAINEFRADLGRCPRSTTELVHPPRSGRRYLRRTPKDGWGNELFVQCPGHFDPDAAEVLSAGPSGDFTIDDNVQ
ncbi:MAG: type II secretion system protein GspG [Myxococcota bacterium]